MGTFLGTRHPLKRLYRTQGGSFQVPTPPATSVPSKPVVFIDEASQYSGKCRYRRWTPVNLDGVFCSANGCDQPWYWDGTVEYDLGSVAPTHFTITEVAGSTFSQNTVVTYYCVDRSDGVAAGSTSLLKESAAEELTVTIAGATGDVQIGWTTPAAGAELNGVAIYRVMAESSAVVLVHEVYSTAGPWTDSQADTAVEQNRRYVERVRTTLPPIFKGIEGRNARLWGWVQDSTNLYFSQAARLDEWVLGDFPDGNLVQIGPEDGYGEITGLDELYGVLYVFKRRAVYALDGEPGGNPGNLGSLVAQRLFADRGCLGAKTIVPISNALVFLDERGIYLMAPNGESRVAGALPETEESPLEPIWRRLNLGLSEQFFAVHNEADGHYECWVALDHDPVVNTRIIYDYRTDRYVSIDYDVVGCAGGRLETGSREQRVCRIDDFGYLWEQDRSNSEGVFDGDLTATVTSSNVDSVTCSGASFDTTFTDGSAGAPVDIYNSTGDVIDLNRVYGVTSGTELDLLYVTVGLTNAVSLAVGVIPFLCELPKTGFSLDRPKNIHHLVIEHEILASSPVLLRVEKAKDNDDWSLAEEFELTGDGVQTVPIHLRGRRHHQRMIMRYAAQDLAIVELYYHIRATDLKQV